MYEYCRSGKGVVGRLILVILVSVFAGLGISKSLSMEKTEPRGERERRKMNDAAASEDHQIAACAKCGKEETDGVELKVCNTCKFVKYCGKDCRVAHRPKHRKKCKRRAAKLHDEELFRQPPKGDDCPICFLLLPTLESGRLFRACCGKLICSGCVFEHKRRSNGSPTCPFCRANLPSEIECNAMIQKRVDGNDADALNHLGGVYSNGDSGIKKDVDKAAKLFHRAAELGSPNACFNLANGYFRGDGVNKDKTKARYYWELAAMAGCTHSRFNLGIIDADDGRFDRAIKHWLIAANCGDIKAIDNIKKAMARGHATRDHYAQALRGCQLYLDEVRSDQRDRAAAYSDDYKYLFDS